MIATINIKRGSLNNIKTGELTYLRSKIQTFSVFDSEADRKEDKKESPLPFGMGLKEWPVSQHQRGGGCQVGLGNSMRKVRKVEGGLMFWDKVWAQSSID